MESASLSGPTAAMARLTCGERGHLAEQLRTGAIKTRVFKEVGAYKTLREIGRTHAMVVQDVVRVQNRIKALYRSRGVAVSGKGVYAEKGREEFLQKLPDASRGAAKTLYAQYDAVEEIRRCASMSSRMPTPEARKGSDSPPR
jgi:hypothetical protein